MSPGPAVAKGTAAPGSGLFFGESSMPVLHCHPAAPAGSCATASSLVLWDPPVPCEELRVTLGGYQGAGGALRGAAQAGK